MTPRAVEIASGLLTTTLLLLAALACAGGTPTARAPGDELPKTAGGMLPDNGRVDPWHRLAEFEREYRSGSGTDACVNYYPGEYIGRCALLYPKSVRREAAWTYVLLGRDFAARKEWGAAARAEWAALSLVRKTVASRPDRERIRLAAYTELAAIAKARSQNAWADLLALPAQLIEAYLASPEAREDAHKFDAVLQKIEDAEAEEDRARAAANRQATWGAVQAGLNQLNAQAMSRSNPQAALQMTIQNIGETVQFSMNMSNQWDEIRAAAGEESQFLREFAGVVADDVTEIQVGQSFVAREVVFFVLAARNKAPYAEAISKWAENKPGLKAKVVGGANADSLGKDVQARELHAARYERRGVAGPPFIEEAGAADVQASPQSPLGASYEIVEGAEPGTGTRYTGTLEIESHGPNVHMQWHLSDAVVTGVGIVADGLLHAAWGRSHDVGISVYAVNGGTLTGRWATLNSDTASGEEVLEGQPTLGGNYRVTNGKLPNGQAYGGTVMLLPTHDTFDARMTLDGEPYRGVGIRRANTLAVGWAPGAQGAGVTVYEITADGLRGVWAAPGGTKLGREVLRRVR